VITMEQHPQTYLVLMVAHDLPDFSTWMICNFPRSDFNPALAAGINAIAIPPPRTGHLELESISALPPPGRRLIEPGSIVALLDTFEG